MACKRNSHVPNSIKHDTAFIKPRPKLLYKMHVIISLKIIINYMLRMPLAGLNMHIQPTASHKKL